MREETQKHYSYFSSFVVLNKFDLFFFFFQMDAWLHEPHRVELSLGVTVKESLSETFFEIKLQDPALAKKVFGFRLQDDTNVTYPRDTGKIAFPLVITDCKYDSLLLEAIKIGDAKRTYYLLNELRHDPHMIEWEGKNALHFALSHDHVNLLVRYLVECAGMSLLSVPIEVENMTKETQDFILSQPNVVSILKTWFPSAIRQDLIMKFIQSNNGVNRLSALQRFIRCGDEQASLFLLSDGPKDLHLAIHRDCGTNALHFALQASSLPVLKVLIMEKKMDLCEKDGQGRPSLMWLKPIRNEEVIGFLMALPNFEAIKTANRETYFVKKILPKYDVSLLNVCIKTAALFDQHPLEEAKEKEQLQLFAEAKEKELIRFKEKEAEEAKEKEAKEMIQLKEKQAVNQKEKEKEQEKTETTMVSLKAVIMTSKLFWDKDEKEAKTIKWFDQLLSILNSTDLIDLKKAKIQASINVVQMLTDSKKTKNWIKENQI